VARLFEVLDTAERWLTATGQRDWRSGMLSQRSQVHEWLGELDAAIATAEGALVAYQHDSPGETLGGLR
jgi:hypothetical protein